MLMALSVLLAEEVWGLGGGHLDQQPVEVVPMNANDPGMVRHPIHGQDTLIDHAAHCRSADTAVLGNLTQVDVVGGDGWRFRTGHEAGSFVVDVKVVCEAASASIAAHRLPLRGRPACALS